MKRPLHIGIRLPRIDTLDANKTGNVLGDELIAKSWQKYLTRHEDVERVCLYSAQGKIEENLDILIHFHTALEIHPKAKNILYLQNVFRKTECPGGTIGVFNFTKERFDGYMFSSQNLMNACASGVVVPFATDPELFQPKFSKRYQHSVSFVGNNIRGEPINQRYFSPALPFGLAIYGNDWKPPLLGVCRGKLPAIDLPELYSNSQINLNAHAAEHLEFETINLRIYDILACAGFVISDYMNAIPETFGDSVICTEGYEDEWAKIVRYLEDSEGRQKRSEEGRKIVLSHHTYAQRIKIVLDFIKEII